MVTLHTLDPRMGYDKSNTRTESYSLSERREKLPKALKDLVNDCNYFIHIFNDARCISCKVFVLTEVHKRGCSFFDALHLLREE